MSNPGPIVPAERLRPALPAPALREPAARVVGFVGGVGCGKSTLVDAVAEHLYEHGDAAGRRSAPVIVDGDTVGHETRDQPDVIEQIVARFGDGVLAPDGTVDRQALGLRVFGQSADGQPLPAAEIDAEVGAESDPKANLQALEAIMHPAMRTEFEHRMAAAPAGLVLFDAAILLEAGWDDLCHEIVFVDVDDATRQQRVTGRGWTVEQWQARERSQWPLDRKRAHATLHVTNGPPQPGPDEAAASLVALLDEPAG